MALIPWVVFRKFGGMAALATATTRHQADAVLRRLGGWVPQGIPDCYFDQVYGCEMRLLAFDTAILSARMEPIVRDLNRYFAAGSVITMPAVERVSEAS
jgi:hypothetical protein